MASVAAVPSRVCAKARAHHGAQSLGACWCPQSFHPEVKVASSVPCLHGLSPAGCKAALCCRFCHPTRPAARSCCTARPEGEMETCNAEALAPAGLCHLWHNSRKSWFYIEEINSTYMDITWYRSAFCSQCCFSNRKHL